ncbi:hypothetical protein TNCV_4125271 [Trichonephila clavipes]|nr:hypothetical protein TNCV_4125271 [Trichonephila clavipes]
MSKPQYDREQPANFFKARIEEMIQNDRQVTLSEILSELGLRYGSLPHIIFDVLRYPKSCENIRRDQAQWTVT